MSTEYIPYTYLIGWTQHNTWYYGRRTAKGCHPSELWVKYFTSSSHVADFVAAHGAPDVIQIRQTFPEQPKKCSTWESVVLRRIDAQHKEQWLNKKNGDEHWDTTGISNPQSDKSKKKYKDTVLKRYGVENVSHSDTIKEKREETFLQRYGVTNSFHRDNFLTQAKETWIEKYGVDNPNKRQVICQHCGEKVNIVHVGQCKKNPDRYYSGHPGAKNPKAKTFVVEDPNGLIYTLVGEFTKFCKQNQISARLLSKNKTTKGWRLLS